MGTATHEKRWLVAGAYVSRIILAAAVAGATWAIGSRPADTAPLIKPEIFAARKNVYLLPAQARPGQDNGQGPGNGNGAGNGNGNGPGNGNGNGPGNGNGNGPGNGNGNGPGNGNGNGPGNGNGNGNGAAGVPPLAQNAAVVAPGLTIVHQVQQVVEKDLAKDGAKLNGALGGIHSYSMGNGLSAFTVSGLSHLRHQGFEISTPGESFRGPAFDTLTYGLTTGVRWDGSDALGLSPNTLTFGAFGNYSTSNVDIGAEAAGLLGKADVESFGVGGYALYNLRPFYLLGVFAHSWTHAETDNARNGVGFDQDGTGHVASAGAGTIVPLGGGLDVDLRLGVNMIHGSFEDYWDSGGSVYQDASVHETSGTGSAKLFFSQRLDDTIFRPFAQAGFSRRFSGENTVTVDGAEFRYDDSDLAAFGRIGIDIDHGESFQSYFALRGDASSDYEAISGQFGVTFKLK
jgi:hypothetical protein